LARSAWREAATVVVTACLVGLGCWPRSVHAQLLMRVDSTRPYQRELADVARGEAPSLVLGQGFDAFRRYDAATALKLVDEYLQAVRNDPVKAGVATDLLGLIYQRDGRVQAAAQQHRGALAILERAGAAGAEALRQVKNNLAVAYHMGGEHHRAGEILSDLIDENPGPTLTRARALNNRGLVHLALGQLDRARLDLDKAKAAAARDRLVRAHVFNNLATVYAAEGDWDAALIELDEARRLARQANDRGLEANVLDSRATVLLRVGRHGVALAALDEARALLGTDGAVAVKLAIDLTRGVALTRLGRRAEAERVLDEVVRKAEETGLVGLLRRALRSRGEVREPGSPAGALEDYRAAIKLVETTRTRLSREEEREYLAQIEGLYAAAVRTLIVRRRPGDLEEAIGLVARSQSKRLHEELLGARGSVRDQALDRYLQETKDVLRQEEILHGELQAESELVPPRAEAIAMLKRRLEEVRARVADLGVQIAGRNPGAVGDHLGMSQVSYAALRDSLPNGHLVVALYALEDRVVAFLISRGRVEFRQKLLARRDLEKQIVDYRRELTRGLALGGAIAPPPVHSWGDAKLATLRGRTRALYDTLLAPIAAEIAGANHIVFAPTGLIHYVPLHALGPWKQPETPAFLIERAKLGISYVTNAHLLKLAPDPAAQASRQAARPALLGIGGVTFDNPAFPLRSSKEEVEEIGRIFVSSGGRAEILSEAEATREELLRRLKQFRADGAERGGAAVPPPEFIHVATHAVIQSRAAEESWLALAGQDRLLASEIATLDLKGVELLVLSACETALAQERPGAALMGLSWYAEMAGVRSTMVSLWSVNDRGTARLMRAFYDLLVAQRIASKAEALKRAQRSVMLAPETRHPFYWAPFILLGH
jgi:CHAT domain-containing protein/tetratricopeptide (TPR) repeat protein